MTHHLAATALVAFVDESKKPDRDRLTGRALPQSWYAMAAVIVLAGEAGDLRDRLVGMGGGHRSGLHYAQMTNATRRSALRRVNELTEWEAQIVEIEHPVQTRQETTVRRAVLAALLRLVTVKHGVTSIVIESRSRRTTTDTLDLEDRLLMAELVKFGQLPKGLELRHGRKDEPLLWLPDLVVGARTDALSRSDWRPWSEVVARVPTTSVQARWRGPKSAEAPGH